MELIINTSNRRKDKYDIILQELVNARSWKQALANCEKRLKKGEKNDGFLVNRAHILLSFPDSQHQLQGSTELCTLLERKPPITDVDVLLAIERNAEARHDNDARIVSMWERAAGVSPGDEELYKIWFTGRFKKGDYKSAQKAAMVYQKKFPQNREPFFWAIVSSHLAATAPEATDFDKRLFGPLAYRLISKAASDAKETPSHLDQGLETGINALNVNSSKAVRALQTSGEIRLLITIFRSQGKYKEALEVLDGPQLGLASRIGIKSWDLVLEKLELYGLCERWDDQWRFCHALLLEALGDSLLNSDASRRLGFGQFGDDWKVWSGLLAAAAKIDDPKIAVLTLDLIESHLTKSMVSQNARLALIAYSSGEISLTKNGRELFLFSCQEYFKTFSSKPVCFVGLNSYVHRLQATERLSLLSTISQCTKESQSALENGERSYARWVMSEINVLKLDYSLVVSQQENLSNTALLEAFIGNCLRLYRISKPIGSSLPVSERRPGDDAAILAAMGCVHLYKTGQKTALLRCALILEILLSDSKHNYDALLIIIRVYFYLGAITRAVEFYGRLDIKHMQYQTLSWIMFNRISTIHPHPVMDKANASIIKFNPASAINTMLRWIFRNEEQMRAGISLFLDNCGYVNLLDHLATLENLEDSLYKRTLMCEISRINRLGHCLTDIDPYSPEALLKYATKDGRDTTAYPSYEAHGQARFEEHIRPGPMPGFQWVARQLRILFLEEYLRRPIGSLSEDLLSTLIMFDSTDELTRDERVMDLVTAMLVRLVSLASSTSDNRGDEGTARNLFRAIETSWSIPAMKQSVLMAQNPNTVAFQLPGILIPHWQFFHQIYVWFDICQLFSPALKVTVEANRQSGRIAQSWLETKATQFRAVCEGIYINSYGAAAKMQMQLDGPGAVRDLTDACLGHPDDAADTIGTEIRTLVDRSWMELLSKELLASWREALDGILLTKLRL